MNKDSFFYSDIMEELYRIKEQIAEKYPTPEAHLAHMREVCEKFDNGTLFASLPTLQQALA